MSTLMMLGDLSSLRPLIGEQHPFDNPHPYGSDEYKAHADEFKDMCMFYGRDRGEADTSATIHANVTNWLNNGEEYNYLFDNGKWFVSGHETDGLELLQDVLAAEKVVD